MRGERRERRGEREKKWGQNKEEREKRGENLQEIFDLLDAKKVSVCKCNRFNNIE